jgi:hypothetical protein
MRRRRVGDDCWRMYLLFEEVEWWRLAWGGLMGLTYY